MELKKIGILLLVIAIVLSSLFLYFRIRLEQSYKEQIISEVGGECKHTGEGCPYDEINKLFWPTLLISISLVMLLVISIYLILPRDRKEKLKVQNIISKLSKDESSILNIIQENEGSALQSDLVEKSGLNKVKVTRILDKLEGRGLIERKRRGMTNVVILKPRNS